MVAYRLHLVNAFSLPGYGPVTSLNRPVRTRMPGGVGAGGENPPATRLAIRDWTRSVGLRVSEFPHPEAQTTQNNESQRAWPQWY